MDLSKVKPSKNLDDHTGRGEVGKFLDFLFTNLNPKYAYDKIKYGDRRQDLDFRNSKPSKNFKDETGGLINPEFFNPQEGGTWQGDRLNEHIWLALVGMDPLKTPVNLRPDERSRILKEKRDELLNYSRDKAFWQLMEKWGKF